MQNGVHPLKTLISLQRRSGQHKRAHEGRIGMVVFVIMQVANCLQSYEALRETGSTW